MRSAEGAPPSPFWTAAKMSAREFSAYPGDVFIEFFTYPVVFLSYYFFLRAAAAGWPPGSLPPVPELAAYYALGWLMRMVFHQQTDLAAGAMIATGDIAVQLTRPMNFRTLMLARATGRSLARTALYAVPGAATLAVFAGSPDFLAPGNPLLFVLLGFSGFLILFELQMMIGAMAFYTTLNYQVSWTLDMIVRLVSGLVVPLAVFPAPVRAMLELLPFPHIYAFPIQAWLSPLTPEQGLLLVLRALAWVIALRVLNRRLLENALARLTVCGG